MRIVVSPALGSTVLLNAPASLQISATIRADSDERFPLGSLRAFLWSNQWQTGHWRATEMSESRAGDEALRFRAVLGASPTDFNFTVFVVRQNEGAPAERLWAGGFGEDVTVRVLRRQERPSRPTAPNLLSLPATEPRTACDFFPIAR
jgi:hypothetical protein